jgi:AcrR family transcriptional regulator
MTPAAPAHESPFPSAEVRLALRERKREAILLTAVRMFNERGFHATSLDDVAMHLGINKPVVYHYLGNKDQVLFECVQRGLAQLLDAAAAAHAQPGSGLHRLEALLIRYAEINMEDFGRCVIRTGDELLSPENRSRFRALKREIDSALRDLVREAAQDGSAHVDDIRLTSFAIAGALNWPARWHRDDGPLSRRQIAVKLAAYLIDGIRPRADQGRPQ